MALNWLLPNEKKFPFRDDRKNNKAKMHLVVINTITTGKGKGNPIFDTSIGPELIGFSLCIGSSPEMT